MLHKHAVPRPSYDLESVKHKHVLSHLQTASLRSGNGIEKQKALNYPYYAMANSLEWCPFE